MNSSAKLKGSSHKLMHGFEWWEVCHAVTAVLHVASSRSESIGVTADDLGLVIEPFGDAVVAGHSEATSLAERRA